MFAFIDNLLLVHAPSWYKTPKVQTITLGIVFFWTFSAYTTIQFYSASTYGPSLAADSVSAVYITFTLTCLISPGIINKYGCRLCMFLGVLGYASLVLTSLIYFLYGGEDVLWARRLVVMGGAVLGCGASILWTAQGRLILQYAARAEQIDSSTATNSEGIINKSQTGKLMSLFWAIFQCSSLVGGCISFLYYNRKPNGSTSLYVLFLGFIFLGSLFTQLLLPPSMLVKANPCISADDIPNQQKDLEMVTEQTPFTTSSDSSSEYIRGESQIGQGNGISMNEDLSHQSWLEEAKGTLRIVLNKRMFYLSPLFFYTGFNQPYQQATFGNRFFTRRTIGAELIIFHLMEIIGAIVCGRFLDREGKGASDTTSRRHRAIVCLIFFVIINSVGNILAANQERNAEKNGIAIAHDISNPSVIPPSLAFACWGFAE